MPQFPRNNEGQWSFVYAGDDSAGEIIVTLGFTVDDFTFYTQSTNDDVYDAWSAVVAVTCDSSLSFPELRTLKGVSGAVIEVVSTGATVGGLSGNDMLPLNNAVLVKKITGLTGRRNRGRMYLPGIPEDAVSDSGIVLSSFRTTINSALAGFVTAVTDIDLTGLQVAILHREITIPEKPAYHLDDAAATHIDEFVTDVKIASQRGRLR